MRIESRATNAFCFAFFVATGLAACGGGGGGGNGGGNNTGTAGGTTTSGNTGTTTNGTASCSMCDKAATCCAAVLNSPEVSSFFGDASLLSGLLGDASVCSSFSTATCNELGAESATYAMDCQQEIQDGQGLGLSACN